MADNIAWPVRALHVVIFDCTMSINNKVSVGVAHIDYRPAFESNSITKLLLKLRSFRISGQLLNGNGTKRVNHRRYIRHIKI